MRSFHCIDNLVEGRNIADSQISQHLAIQVDVGGLERVDERAVLHTSGARTRVDAGDPQLAQLTAALAAIPVAVPQALHHRFVGAAEQAVLGSPLTFGQLQYFLVTAASDIPALCTCHLTSLPLSDCS